MKIFSCIAKIQLLVLVYPSPGGQQKQVQVSKQEAKLLIEDFDPSKEYNFKIIAVSGGRESKPLQAKHEGKRLTESSTLRRSTALMSELIASGVRLLLFGKCSDCL